MKTKGRTKSQRGMTLVEIMVVITIMGLIMGVVAVAVVDQMNAAKVKTARLETKTFENSLDLYLAQKGRYPEPSAGLKALLESRLIKELKDDPWDQPYVYSLKDGEPFIQSYGADGAPGGDGYDADITNRDPRPR